MIRKSKVLVLLLLLSPVICLAADEFKSILFSKPQQVSSNVWSAIGATAPPRYENSGHNNNLTFIITSEGVVVVNAGDNYLLAKSLHEEIKAITDQPVKYVILENGQGHAALGSSYWQQQGVPVIAHIDTKRELEAHGYDILDRMKKGRKEKAIGTELSLPDETFEDKKIIELGGERIEVLNLGPTHSPGDVIVWLPKQKLVITGDMAFYNRMLPIMEHTDTAGWLETWEKFAALKAEIVIPGHGGPTNMQEVTKHTKDYLVYMRAEVSKLLEEGESLHEATKIDQSAYQNLDVFEELALRNASILYRAMEFE